MTGNALVRWLLGLQSVPSGAPDVRFAWEHPVSPASWVVIVGAAVLVGWLSYRRMEIGRARRRSLVALRSAVIVLLAMLLAGPLLEVPRESIEPDAVIVLADRSRSMEVEDLVGPGGSMQSRDAALRSLAMAPTPFDAIGAEHRVQWYGFSDALAPLARDAGGVAVGDAVGDRSLLALAIDQALLRSAGRPVSAIVLLTDGRTTDPPDRTLLRRLQAEGIAVSAVALGADAAMGDSSVAEIHAPRRAFSKDLVPVEAVVERRGPARTRALRVELVDTGTGTVIDRAELPPSNVEGDTPRLDTVQLVASPASTGDARWEVRVSESEAARDLLPANDRRAVPITLVDRPMRVLYVDGYPRWEYRYLKNLLQRERTIESSVMLLSADRDFAQEGNTPIARLPRTREEFERYDLIVLGDLPATFFTGEQLTEMRRAVAERGTGLAWIGLPS